MTYIILLRGVMPTGKNRLPMAQLREVVSAAGYGRVRTWIQSGNLLLDSEQGRQETASCIRALIREQIGPDLAVVIRTPEEIQKVLDGNPFGEGFLPERVFLCLPGNSAAPGHSG